MALGISEAVELTRKIAELAKKGITLELQERITDLREAVINAKDDAINLRDEIQALKAKVRAQEDWDSRMAAYTLIEAAAGAMVYKSQGPPEHFACPACIERRSIHILQPQNNWNGLCVCPSCTTGYRVNPRTDGG